MMIIEGVNVETQYNISVYYPTEDPITPQIRNNIVERGSYGSIDYRSSFGNVPFTLLCNIEGREIRRKMKEFSSLFVDDNGDFKEVKLQFSPLGDNVYYLVKLTSQIVLKYDEDSLYSADFTLELLATFPFGQSIYRVEKYFDNVNLSGGPLEIPISYYGTFRTGFEFTFFGTLSYFDIEILFKDGIKKVFHYTSNSHSTYFVCNFNDFIIDDNGSNGLSNGSGDFVYINKGVSKIIFRGDMTGSMNFAYRELYI